METPVLVRCVTACGSALLALSCAAPREPAPTGQQPPVILVTIDTLRADHLPAWGYPRDKLQTPAIDRLVRDGVRFANAYSQVPLTLPSHTTLLTGLPPYEHGVRSNVGFTLDGDRFATLAKRLQSAGYATGAAVSAYVLRGETGISSGFDFFDDSLEVNESDTLGMIQRDGATSLRAATQWLESVADRPFFLWLHLFEPHTPYDPPEPFRSQTSSLYDGEIAAADALVGSLLETLDQGGLYSRSLVILASDHGEGLNDHGEEEHGILLYREAVHVPLVIKRPDQRGSGSTVSDPVALSDVVPTVLSELGLARAPELAGLPLFGPLEANREIYSETLGPRLHLGWSELRSLTDGQYQLIDGPDPELYDVTADPGEHHNLRASDPDAFARLSAHLDEIPLRLNKGKTATAEERTRLAALGYLTGPAPTETDEPRRDPKASIGLLDKVNQAHHLVRFGRVLEALNILEPLVRDNPDMIDARVQLAAVLRHLGRTREARDEYLEVVRRAPDYKETIAQELGKIEIDLGNLEAAEEMAQLTMKEYPDEAHLLLSAIAVGRKDWDLAEQEAKLATGDPERPRVSALLMLAKVYAGRGEYDRGIAVLEDTRQHIASKTATPTPTVDSTLGDLLARVGRSDAAEAAFRREIATFPQTTEAYTRLAILLASQHRFSEIKPTLDALVQAVPTPGSYALAATTMDDLGNQEDAAKYRQGARELAKQMGVATSSN